MVKRFGVLLVMLLCCGMVAAGCGDDEGSGSGGGNAATPTATATAEATSEATTEATAEATEDSGGDVDPTVQAAVDQCKQSIDSNPAISDASLKDDLKAICDQAASGDVEAVNNATRDVCIRIIEETVPDNNIAETAKQACESAAG